MAKRSRTVTLSSIQRKHKEKRGEGVLRSYKPWITIRDVPSTGMGTRIKGWKTGRVHHFLSNLELDYFYMLEWSQIILDIREQWPMLPQEKTILISEKLGIRHPTDPKSRLPIIMTTDFFLTVHTSEGIKYWAHTVKPRSKLTRRVIEKFEIERRFFEDIEVDWRLITEQEIDKNLVHNIKWIHSAKTLEGRPYLTDAVVSEVTPVLLKALENPTIPCSMSTYHVDRKFELPPGSSLFLLRHMVANRYWEIDMSHPLEPALDPIKIKRTTTLSR